MGTTARLQQSSLGRACSAQSSSAGRAPGRWLGTQPSGLRGRLFARQRPTGTGRRMPACGPVDRAGPGSRAQGRSGGKQARSQHPAGRNRPPRGPRVGSGAGVKVCPGGSLSYSLTGSANARTTPHVRERVNLGTGRPRQAAARMTVGRAGTGGAWFTVRVRVSVRPPAAANVALSRGLPGGATRSRAPARGPAPRLRGGCGAASRAPPAATPAPGPFRNGRGRGRRAAAVTGPRGPHPAASPRRNLVH